MKRNSKKFYAVWGAFLIGCHVLTANSKPNALAEQLNELPPIIQAVAPPFIPFIFGETGKATVVVEVKIGPDGKVNEAHIIEASLFADKSFEDTAKRWLFVPADGKTQRTARLTFMLRIMPKGTPWNELTTIFTTPYQVEVRHEVFDRPTNSDPNPIKPAGLVV